MADEPNNKPTIQPAPQPAQPVGEEGGDPKQSQSVPYDRFKQVNDERKALEERLAKLEADAKARHEKELAEQNRWKELAEQRERELETERIERLRLQAAATAGLPADMAARLQGSTLEELAKDAAALKEFMKPVTPGTPPVPPRNGAAAAITPENLRDPKWVRENQAKIMEAARNGGIPT